MTHTGYTESKKRQITYLMRFSIWITEQDFGKITKWQNSLGARNDRKLWRATIINDLMGHGM